MRKSLHLLLVALVALTIAGSAMAADHAPVAAGIVNLNTADASQLSLLPRVGIKAAQRIVDYRRDHGAFKKTSDLMQVKGFGDKKYQRLAPFLTVDGKTTLTQKVKSPRKPRTPKASTSHPTSR